MSGTLRTMLRTVLLLASLGTAAGASIENRLWRVEYSSSRAVATAAGSPARTVYQSRPDPDCPTLDDVWQATPTALVGSRLSYFENVERYCGAHPALSRRFVTIDLKTGRAVSLLDWFGSSALLGALRQDQFLSKTVGAGRRYASLGAFVADYNARNKDCLTFGDGRFQNFTFYDYDPVTGRVAVRLQLAARFSDCNPGLTQLGFWMTAPVALRNDLLEAKKRGNLMRSLKNQTSYPLR